MKIKQRLFTFLSIILLVFLLQSCFKRQFVKGKVEIVSVTDSTLHDSSLFAGHVYNYNFGDTNILSPIEKAQIIIEKMNFMTYSDAAGYFSIKGL